ncbi:MAG: hypothetical protein ACC628_12925 [Pirellulaceae bacterium]
MMRQRLIKSTLVAGMLALLTGTASVADAFGRGGHGHAVSYQMVQRTVRVPTIVPEIRTIRTTEYHNEVRERTVTVHRYVPETKQVTETYTVMVPEQRTRTLNYVVCRPVWEEVEQTYTVNIPQQEQRTGVRNVCRLVQVQEMRTVCRDAGHWEEQELACGRTRMVWVSNIVTEEVPVTVCKYETTQEEYTYVVITCRPETRTRTVKVCRYVNETQTREVAYTVCVPQQRERVRNVTTYTTVAEQQVQQYTVCVPQTVQKQVTVNVCRRVPQTVTYCVPVHRYCR